MFLLLASSLLLLLSVAQNSCSQHPPRRMYPPHLSHKFFDSIVPVDLTNDPFWSDFCANNQAGNFPDAQDCTYFVVCDQSKPIAWPCSPNADIKLKYYPDLDICGYMFSNDCPQVYPAVPGDCSQIERFWSPMCIPQSPDSSCSPTFLKCFNQSLIPNPDSPDGVYYCPPNYFYSPTYLGCVNWDYLSPITCPNAFKKDA